MKPSPRFILPLSALVLAGSLALTPLLVRGTPTTTPVRPVPPQVQPLGIQIAAGDHAVAVEHMLADGTICLIVVPLTGGAAVVCPTPAAVTPATPTPTTGGGGQ